MACLRVMGGFPLEGEIKVQGSKNAVLPMMAAALLVPGETRFEHCPDIADVRALTLLLEKLGAVVRREGDALVVNAADAHPVFLDARDMADTRGCILLLGALAARFGEAALAHPGGCVIGKRPVDLHLSALRALGAELSGEEVIHCKAGRLKGAEIVFPIPSVGATQNALLAAVLADGRTWIHNAAREPEVVHLCNFLNAAGAKVTGIGTAHLSVCGVKKLFPVSYTVPADRIVAGTYLAAVLCAGGRVCLKGADAAELSAVIGPLRQAGGEVRVSRDGILARKKGRLRAFDYIRTEPYPAFPTDMQSQFLVLACLAEGVSVVEETIFEARFGVVPELKKMGAQIYVEENKAVISGVPSLSGQELNGTDLRGTAALVIAGSLLLVNKGHPLPEGFQVPEFTQLVNGHAIDKRAYPALQRMMDACRAAGLEPIICSSFRTWEKQEELFERKVQSCLSTAASREEAEEQAAFWVARPGTSEHQAGLAVDIVDKSYQSLDDGQEETAVQRWLIRHCAEYGFILRYPTEKSELTGVGYEPWHYRYVGEEAAGEIMEQGLCLEEYLEGR